MSWGLLVGLAAVLWALRSALWHARWIITKHPRHFPAFLQDHPGDVVLVTAHPDDECMFFTPTVCALRKLGRTIHLLCLTSGDADGLGKERQAELHRAAALMGIASVHLVDRPEELPDSMSRRWNLDRAVSLIQDWLKSHPMVRHVISFDAWGISGHPNHCDTHAAVRKALVSTPEAYGLLELETLPAILKYMGILGIIYEAVNMTVDLLISRVEAEAAKHAEPGETIIHAAPRYVALIGVEEAWAYGYGAMRMHRSQLVWFRYAYLLASRYMHVNVLTHRSIRSAIEGNT